MVMLGVWVTYFGVLVVVLGLYGLNCASLTRRIHQIERQAARAREAQSLATTSKLDEAQLVEIETIHGSPARWRDRLTRLSALLPPNVAIVSVAVNPSNLPARTRTSSRSSAGCAGPPATTAGGGGRARVHAPRRLRLLGRLQQRPPRLEPRRRRATRRVTEFTIECR